ncbi:hypothetical protein NPIL_558431 [Nephila pilipes]|uniref:Uncharacterized protein n=1 Tax=Nephila pilipes TaxID=299642 RepID=A0A8X6PC08_NEPPI|nr:hypothetical protein NPIL_558431 [Nephila pilipes]
MVSCSNIKCILLSRPPWTKLIFIHGDPSISDPWSAPIGSCYAGFTHHYHTTQVRFSPGSGSQEAPPCGLAGAVLGLFFTKVEKHSKEEFCSICFAAHPAYDFRVTSAPPAISLQDDSHRFGENSVLNQIRGLGYLLSSLLHVLGFTGLDVGDSGRAFAQLRFDTRTEIILLILCSMTSRQRDGSDSCRITSVLVEMSMVKSCLPATGWSPKIDQGAWISLCSQGD